MQSEDDFNFWNFDFNFRIFNFVRILSFFWIVEKGFVVLVWIRIFLPSLFPLFITWAPFAWMLTIMNFGNCLFSWLVRLYHTIQRRWRWILRDSVRYSECFSIISCSIKWCGDRTCMNCKFVISIDGLLSYILLDSCTLLIDIC